eukprot:TRINITY_DN14875_c0_g1_i1.p1 TRINITY_DN14875_c0_g1~~TRINITY_DN14875_c0_g1_i1.p1  ORF type:complete len:631 (-),score=125.02 TRINITY_DN14875_c0_g1_i1:33-1925(-)
MSDGGTDEVLTVFNEEWEYRSEGAEHIVVSYRGGSKPQWRGMVLRVRKDIKKEDFTSRLLEAVSAKDDIERSSAAALAALDMLWSHSWRGDSVRFMKIMSDLLGDGMVDLGTPVSLSPSFLADMSTSLRPLRPPHRVRHCPDLSIPAARMFPDLARMNSGVRPCAADQHDDSVVCFELKPKSATIPLCSDHIRSPNHVKLTTCRYCMLQVHKQANARITVRSSYCPRDLFSASSSSDGDDNGSGGGGNDAGWNNVVGKEPHEVKVRRALRCMMETPQNNMKVHHNSKIILSGELGGGPPHPPHNMRQWIRRVFPPDASKALGGGGSEERAGEVGDHIGAGDGDTEGWCDGVVDLLYEILRLEPAVLKRLKRVQEDGGDIEQVSPIYQQLLELIGRRLDVMRSGVCVGSSGGADAEGGDEEDRLNALECGLCFSAAGCRSGGETWREASTDSCVPFLSASSVGEVLEQYLEKEVKVALRRDRQSCSTSPSSSSVSPLPPGAPPHPRPHTNLHKIDAEIARLMRVVTRFTLATTAKDCSLMVTVKQMPCDGGNGAEGGNKDGGEERGGDPCRRRDGVVGVACVGSRRYLYRLSWIDLGPKPPSKIPTYLVQDQAIVTCFNEDRQRSEQSNRE